MGATGENPVIVASRTADVIVGPIGILAADAMRGEITPTMAGAVGQSRAKNLLLPVNLCNNVVVGTQSLSLSAVLDEAVDILRQILSNQYCGQADFPQHHNPVSRTGLPFKTVTI